MASPAGNNATPTPTAPAPLTSKPLPPRPTTTTTTATTIPKNSTTLTSSPQINTKSGASVYSKPLMLTAYDKYVLGFSMTHLWRCPTKTILVPLFRQNFRAENHLDIGVGTGFFVGDALAERLAKDEHLMPLERDPTSSKLIQPKIKITLMDLNPVALEKAKKRILGVVNKHKARITSHGNGNNKQSGTNVPLEINVNVTTIQADVVHIDHESLMCTLHAPQVSKQFKSISMFNLLHCLPPPAARGQEIIKNRAFKLAAECLADDGVLVGCTILGRKYVANPSRPSAHGSPSCHSSVGGSNIKTGSGSGSGSGSEATKTKKKKNMKNMKKEGRGAAVGRSKPSIWQRSMTWTVMKWYNATGVFGNWADEREGFEKGLRENFEVVETHVEGCMLLFNAARPKRSGL